MGCESKGSVCNVINFFSTSSISNLKPNKPMCVFHFCNQMENTKRGECENEKDKKKSTTKATPPPQPPPLPPPITTTKVNSC